MKEVAGAGRKFEGDRDHGYEIASGFLHFYFCISSTAGPIFALEAPTWGCLSGYPRPTTVCDSLCVAYSPSVLQRSTQWKRRALTRAAPLGQSGYQEGYHGLASSRRKLLYYAGR